MADHHASKFTQRLLSETRAARSPSPALASPLGPGLSRPAPLPSGTSVEARRLPVVPKRPEPLPAVDDVALPETVSAAVGAMGRDTSADETVLRTASSPHSFGPAASRARDGSPLGARATEPPPPAPQAPGAASPARKRIAASPSAVLRAVRPPAGPPGPVAPPAGGDFAAELLSIGQRHSLEQRERERAPSRAVGACLTQPSQGTTCAGDYEGTVAPRPLQLGPDDDDRAGADAAGHTVTGLPLHVPYTPDVRSAGPGGDSAGGATGSRLHPKPMVLRDYQLLADACQRAGRARMEAHAYYKIGEIMASSAETLWRASNFYRRYLNLARRLNDLQGEGKALNSLGIVSYELGCKTLKATGELDAAPLPAERTATAAKAGAAASARQLLEQAVDFHRQHSEIADAAGVFIANTNMGLAASRLGDQTAAAACHKLALQHAVRAGDRAAESLALSNLGVTGSSQGDYATAKVCVERHLELATSAADTTGTYEAHEQLGALAVRRGDYGAASDEFVKALDIALRDGDSAKVRSLRCQIGVVQGLLQVGAAVEATASFMGSGAASM